MDSGLHPAVRHVSGRTNILPTVIKYVDTHGNHIDLTTDKTGDYILFPSLCWHKGFYHDEFNKSFIQAQLFVAPSMGKYMGCLTCSFAGKDFIDGNLDKSVFF
jgi:hypothetical protein